MAGKAMNKNEREAVKFISSSAIVPFTGIIGTGSIFGLKDTLVRDNFTLWVFWLTVGAFAVSALAGVVCTLYLRLSDPPRFIRPLAITSILAFIVAAIGTTILCTLHNQ